MAVVAVGVPESVVPECVLRDLNGRIPSLFRQEARETAHFFPAYHAFF